MAPIDLTRANAIPGWMSDDELRWLGEQAQTCHTIIEVGCFLGHTTVVLAEHVKGIVYAVDPWEMSLAYLEEVRAADPPAYHLMMDHHQTYAEFWNNTREYVERGTLKVCRGTLDQLARLPQPADLIFIDGSHDYLEVLFDIREAKPRLRPGGLLCGHDYGSAIWPDVNMAVHEELSEVENPVGGIWAVRL